MSIDKAKRYATEGNHSATHLLQKALRTVLGDHVHQAGSSVNADRLRFDFTHFSAMTAEELAKVEAIVNDKIAEAIAVDTKVLNIEDAKKTGAKALFGEKYGETVRVVCIGEFSKEFCGGTHVNNTGVITAFKLVSEAGIAAGVRRIEVGGIRANVRGVNHTEFGDYAVLLSGVVNFNLASFPKLCNILIAKAHFLSFFEHFKIAFIFFNLIFHFNNVLECL